MRVERGSREITPELRAELDAKIKSGELISLEHPSQEELDRVAETLDEERVAEDIVAAERAAARDGYAWDKKWFDI